MEIVLFVQLSPKIKQNHCLREVTVAIQNQNTLTIKQCIEKGNLKMFYFTRRCQKNAERSYHPGE
jgi:hypothetical protein